MRKLTRQEIRVFNFLNTLKKTGEIIMAKATPHILDNFDVEIQEAGRILNLWLDNFTEEQSYEFIEVED